MAKRFIWIGCFLFILLNVFLVVNDKNGKVDRISYIPKWTAVTEKDMYDTLKTTGVIDYEEKEFVYFNESGGVFEEFLVDEGDYVLFGNPLYSYEVNNYYEIKAKLDGEADKLDADIKSIKDAIRKMERQIVQSSRLELTHSETNEKIQIEQNNAGLQLQKEQYIIEKERELAQIEAQLDSVESQLKDLASGQGVITVTSPYSGTVTTISTSLANPIMTIESADLHVIGELTENERMKVDTDMEAEIKLVEESSIDTLEGLVEFVSDEPEGLSLNKESIYPFHVSFDEEAEIDDLLRGYHVNLDITLEESLNALVIDKDLVDGGYIWKMDNSGILSELPVETGIEMGKSVELPDGVDKTDWIAIGPTKNLMDETKFITPLKPSKSTWKKMFKDGSRKRSIVIGLLAR